VAHKRVADVRSVRQSTSCLLCKCRKETKTDIRWPETSVIAITTLIVNGLHPGRVVRSTREAEMDPVRRWAEHEGLLEQHDPMGPGEGMAQECGARSGGMDDGNGFGDILEQTLGPPSNLVLLKCFSSEQELCRNEVEALHRRQSICF